MRLYAIIQLRYLSPAGKNDAHTSSHLAAPSSEGAGKVFLQTKSPSVRKGFAVIRCWDRRVVGNIAEFLQ